MAQKSSEMRNYGRFVSGSFVLGAVRAVLVGRRGQETAMDEKVVRGGGYIYFATKFDRRGCVGCPEF